MLRGSRGNLRGPLRRMRSRLQSWAREEGAEGGLEELARRRRRGRRRAFFLSSLSLPSLSLPRERY